MSWAGGKTGSQEVRKKLRKWGGKTQKRKTEHAKILFRSDPVPLSLEKQVLPQENEQGKKNERKWMWLWLPSSPPKWSTCGTAWWGNEEQLQLASWTGLSFSPQLTCGSRHRGPTCAPQSCDPVPWGGPSHFRGSPIQCKKLAPPWGWQWPTRLRGHRPGTQVWVRSCGSYTAIHRQSYRERCFHLTKKYLKIVILKNFPHPKAILQENLS